MKRISKAIVKSRSSNSKLPLKILLLTSSCRKNGNTARMIGLLEEQLKNNAAPKNTALELETVHLGMINLQTCQGCRVCFDNGEELCPLDDDLLGLRAKMREADALILASPVYVEDINGVMKNFIDRLAFVCHRPEFAGKAAYCLTTSGAGSTNHALRTMTMALRTWGFYIAGQSKYRTGALTAQEDLESQYGDLLKGVAEKIMDAVLKGKPLRPAFISLIIFKIQQMNWKNTKNRESLDYLYWYNRGWTDPQKSYYITHKANPAKVKLARLTGRIIGKLFYSG